MGSSLLYLPKYRSSHDSKKIDKTQRGCLTVSLGVDGDKFYFFDQDK